MDTNDLKGYTLSRTHTHRNWFLLRLIYKYTYNNNNKKKKCLCRSLLRDIIIIIITRGEIAIRDFPRDDSDDRGHDLRAFEFHVPPATCTRRRRRGKKHTHAFTTRHDVMIRTNEYRSKRFYIGNDARTHTLGNKCRTVD